MSANCRELYRIVIIETPLAPYFSQCLKQEDLDEMIKFRKKKQLMPKKLVTDEHGEEWEVIDKKKRVFAEVEDEEEEEFDSQE